jgi:hypothetical protein
MSMTIDEASAGVAAILKRVPAHLRAEVLERAIAMAVAPRTWASESSPAIESVLDAPTRRLSSRVEAPPPPPAPSRRPPTET